MKLIVLALVGLVSLPLPAFAHLKWETTEKTLKLDPTLEEATETFSVVNVGDKPVTVLSIKGTCGCTNADMDKKLLKPGDTATLTATMSTGVRIENKTVQVAVETDDPANSDVILSIVRDVSEAARVEPGSVTWEFDPEMSTKVVEVELKMPNTRIASVANVPAGFKAELKTLEEGKRYQVEITPEGTLKPPLGGVVDLLVEVIGTEQWPVVKQLGIPIAVVAKPQ